MAKATVPGLSTLGITLSYGVETVKGQKPTKFTVLERCNDIPEITLETETIDASALEDMQSRYVAGREEAAKLGSGSNLTIEVIEQLDAMMKASATGIKTRSSYMVPGSCTKSDKIIFLLLVSQVQKFRFLQWHKTNCLQVPLVFQLMNILDLIQK